MKDYYVGLDIGTSSIGWSIMDENYHLLKKKHKKTMGVTLFKEGQTQLIVADSEQLEEDCHGGNGG